ncbi:MAG: right-handed parallel beta-helix repeat-containing protein [Rudaea sp.]
MDRLDKRPLVLIAALAAVIVVGLLPRLPIALTTVFASPTYLLTSTSAEPTSEANAEDFPDLTLALPPIPPGSTVFHVSGRTGSDSNPGTLEAPWKTLQHAVTKIHPGDWVLFARGIYRLPKTTTLGPSGTGPEGLTTFAPEQGARVLFTGADGEAPNISFGGDYIRLYGLWFGGTFNPNVGHQIAPGGSSISVGNQIVNNTFFGYNGGIVIGSSERLLIQGNRFVKTGKGKLAHSIYLSGGCCEGQYSQHVIVDHNILIANGGWGTHVFNSAPGAPHNFIITRNFFTGSNWGSIAYGSDNLVANNFYWKLTGIPGMAWNSIGVEANDTHSIYINNVFESRGWLKAGYGFPASPSWTLNTYDHNAHQLTNFPPLAVYVITGTNRIKLTKGREIAEYGVSEAQIDSAIIALKRSFASPVSYILSDTTIEKNFAVLGLRTPSTSPLYQSGNPWFGRPVNVGPNAEAPATFDDFWAAFRALGLREYDRFGKPVGP